jgi:hypothetical protein
MDNPSAAELVATYIKIRDAKAQIQEKLDKEISDLDAKLFVVSQALLAMCGDIGADSIKTEYGLAMCGVKTKYWTSDWASFYNMVKEKDAFELLEKRIHQTHMKQFLEENPDDFPAGLNIQSEYTITVRKPKGA